jgi:hypothetical protein
MSIAYVVVTVLAALMVGYSAYGVFSHAKWTQFLTSYGIPHSWWPWLGAAKAAGALGLLMGLFAPLIGVIAGIGLALYFTGAVITVIHARSYSHLPIPLVYMAPVIGSLALLHAA